MKKSLYTLEILTREYEKRRQRNPRYSMRSFAKALGLSSGRLSELINGRRNISVTTAKRIGEKLQLSKSEINDWCKNLVHLRRTRFLDVKKVNPDDYEVLSNWWYFSILALSQTDDFKADPIWISKRLNIPKDKAETAFNHLIQSKFIIPTREGKFQLSSPNFSSTTELISKAIREGHRQRMTMALDALENTPIEDRDITSIVFAVNKDRLSQAKKMIETFRRQIADYLEEGEKSEVYHFCVQLYPATGPKT